MKLVFLLLSVILLLQGLPVDTVETELSRARFIARDGRPGNLMSPPSELVSALNALSEGARSRSDLAETALNLAIELDQRGIPGGFIATANREERISRLARDYVGVAPAAGQAWCVSAIAEARSGYADAGIQYLKRCFDLAPRDVSLYEGRLNLSLALWDKLPREVRIRAMSDAASGLRDGHFGGWTLERLAYAVAVIAPSREPLARTIIEASRPNGLQQFDQYLSNFRKRDLQTRSKLTD